MIVVTNETIQCISRSVPSRPASHPKTRPPAQFTQALLSPIVAYSCIDRFSGGRHTGRSESARSPISLRQLCHFHNICHRDTLQNKLSDTITPFDFEIYVTVVEQYHSDRPSVIVIYNTRTHVDKILHCEAAPGRNACVCVWRNGDGNIGLDESFATSRNGTIIRRT